MRRAAFVSLLVSVIGLPALAAAGSGHDPAARDAAAAHPRYCPKNDPGGYDARRLIGKRLPRARDAARAYGCIVRVIKRDGESLPVTEDFSWTRINVAVFDGRVTGIDGIY